MAKIAKPVKNASRDSQGNKPSCGEAEAESFS
jgi:hypothetical protein